MSSACLMMALWPCAWAQHNPLGGFAYGDKDAPTGKEWESVEELALNKEYPRAYFFSFDNEAQAAQVRPKNRLIGCRLTVNGVFTGARLLMSAPKTSTKPTTTPLAGI